MRTETIHDIQGAVEPLDTGLERVAKDGKKTFSSMVSFKLRITTTPFMLRLSLCDCFDPRHAEGMQTGHVPSTEDDLNYCDSVVCVHTHTHTCIHIHIHTHPYAHKYSQLIINYG